MARLPPRNDDDLLFEGVPWLERAQEEHDLRSQDVKMLYVHELLAEVLDVPEARPLLGSALRPDLIGPALAPRGDRCGALAGPCRG